MHSMKTDTFCHWIAYQYSLVLQCSSNAQPHLHYKDCGEGFSLHHLLTLTASVHRMRGRLHRPGQWMKKGSLLLPCSLHWVPIWTALLKQGSMEPWHTEWPGSSLLCRNSRIYAWLCLIFWKPAGYLLACLGECLPASTRNGNWPILQIQSTISKNISIR